MIGRTLRRVPPLGVLGNGMLCALIVTGIAYSTAGAQFSNPSANCPCPEAAPGTTPGTTPPGVDMGGQPTLGPLASGVGVPNMLGNLLGGGNSISFFVSRTEGGGFVFGSGTTNVTNTKVADNNSPIPRDRVGFRYNYFNQAVAVTGISDGPPRYDPDWLGNVETPFTKQYNVNMFTFDFEKTFLDGLFSVQVRVPFARTLSSNLDLSYGSINSADPTIQGTDLAGNPIGGLGEVLNVQRTPQDTLGREGTEFGNVQLIFKTLLYQTASFAFSGGLSVGIPTADDTQVRVVDYLGNLRYNNAEAQRVRDFHIENETWALSPFVAFVSAPNDRWFLQGFAEVEVPLNSSSVTFRNTLPVVRPGLTGFDASNTVLPAGGRFPPFEEYAEIREQTLLHLDIGLGFWAYRNLQAQWLTGIAPTVELHYTTTLNDSDIAQFSNDVSHRPAQLPNGNFDPNLNNLVPSPGPEVGNRRNRMDILDMTVGASFQFANQSTLGLGVAFPLRGGDDRTYEWEFQVQYNIYFGGARPRVPNYQ